MTLQSADIDTQMKKGLLEACVLVALENGESYGYKIIEDLQSVIEISESTLYPILKRLEAGGLLLGTSREHKGRLRRYYVLTHYGGLRIRDLRRQIADMDRIHKFIIGGKNNEEI